MAALAAALVGWLGPIALPAFAFAALWSALGVMGAMACAASVLLAAEWLPKVVVLAAPSMPSAASALSTLGPPVMAALGLAAAMRREARVAALGRILGFGLFLGAAIWGLCEARWVGADVLSAPTVRLVLTCAFVLLCTPTAGRIVDDRQAHPAALLTSLVLSAALAGAVVSQQSPATSVVFDEAHGDWASTALPLGPDDFGRNTTYSWRALANVLENVGVDVQRGTNAKGFEPPPAEALYVLKMPLHAIDPVFARGLLHWVSAGGRLLVVADHTDLFDTSQNLNAVLAAIGVRISPTAVFDRLGQPPVSARAQWSEPSWFRPVNDHRYLTGSSFESLPWSALPVHTYGMSFAEQAQYFKVNRFGYFQPDLAHPFGNHIAVAMLSHGSGSIQIWLDSTHWSTFAAFVSNYQDAFRQAIRRSGMVLAPMVYSTAIAAVSALAALCLLLPTRPFLLGAALSISIGVSLGAAGAVRLVEADSVNSARIVNAAIGATASVELLAPIVESTSRNYSRALTALQKWTPVRLHPSARDAGTSVGASALLVDMGVDRLPAASRVLEWVASGKRVVLLSDPRLLTAPEQQRWLGELGFLLRVERGLSEERDASSELLGRREPVLLRRAIVRFAHFDTSPWTEVESTHLAQSFVLRQSAHRAIDARGVLVLSSRSDQFSDAAMGDVWDGVPVDDLSRLRERQLAQLVIGDEVGQVKATPFESRPHSTSASSQASLPSRFLVVSRGQLQAEGTLANESPGPELSLAETPDAFAWRLRADASRFLPNCSLDANTGYCSRTLVDSRLVEWLVVPQIDTAGDVVRLELIHEGRFSGMRDGMNVLFE